MRYLVCRKARGLNQHHSAAFQGDDTMYRRFMFCSALIFLIGDAYPQTAAPDEAKLARRLTKVPARDSMPEQFIAILQAAEVSGGIVSSHAGCSDGPKGEGPKGEGPKGEHPVLENLSAAQALDALAAADGAHRWVSSDGAVVLLPVGGVPALLETRIAAVHLSDSLNMNLSLQELLTTREVVGAIGKLGLSQQQFELGFQKLHAGLPKPRARPLDFQNITLLQGLNAIVGQHYGFVWAYDEYHCRGYTFRLTFISQ